MTHCYDEGTLRAYLDDALPADEHAAVATHTAQCSACQREAAQLRAHSSRVGALLSTPTVEPHAALERFRRSQANVPTMDDGRWTMGDQPSVVRHSSFVTKRRNPMNKSTRRPLFAGLAALVVAVCLLALPPVRAAADQLLQVFRVQTVLFVPTDRARIEQLQNLNIDKEALFLSKPAEKNDTPPRTVASVDEAAQAVGHPVAQASQFPSTPTAAEYLVRDGETTEFQVNVATVRDVLTQMDVNDVTIPDALGDGPISAAIPAMASTKYTGADYEMRLSQVESPQVTLPNGVDLSQLGKAALRLLGMDPMQAEAARQQIDWNSTLVFPFPADANNIRQVTVNGAQGLLMSGGARGEQHHVLQWQRDGMIYVLEAHGNMRDDVLADALMVAAGSVK